MAVSRYLLFEMELLLLVNMAVSSYLLFLMEYSSKYTTVLDLLLLLIINFVCSLSIDMVKCALIFWIHPDMQYISEQTLRFILAKLVLILHATRYRGNLNLITHTWVCSMH